MLLRELFYLQWSNMVSAVVCGLGVFVHPQQNKHCICCSLVNPDALTFVPPKLHSGTNTYLSVMGKSQIKSHSGITDHLTKRFKSLCQTTNHIK